MYDQSDYEKHPGKYRLFKTARIAENIKSLPGLKIGQLVAIRYFDTRINAGCGGVPMPIYEVHLSGDEARAEYPDYLFACALKDFRL